MEVIDILRRNWEPYPHCSNCRNCVVYRDGLHSQEMAKCKMGYGPDKMLGSLIRTPNGRGWKKVSECPNYESMD